MCDENIRTTLRKYVTDSNTWFHWYHNIERLKGIRAFIKNEKIDKSRGDEFLKHFQDKYGNPIDEVLAGFLDSTLDEARLKNANNFSKYVLYISDKQSFSYFRRAESKREMSREIDYNNQRDHAVHTLYNYLLGWYIFENLPVFRGAFKNIFSAFGISETSSTKEKEFYKNHKIFTIDPGYGRGFWEEITLVNQFGDVWPIASLLHDVGYILEGSISPTTSKIEHDRVTNGTKVLHDYFNHWLWRFTKVDFRSAIDIATSMNCVVPNFNTSKSIPALSDRLRDIGNLRNISNKNMGIYLNPDDTNEYAINLEGFELWRLFYRKYFNKTNVEVLLIEENFKNELDLTLIKPYIENNMERILVEVKDEYENDIWEGGILSKINLNHGVCGGLMLLQAATFWYEYMWGLKLATLKSINKIQEKQESNEPVSEKTFNNIQEEITNTRIPAHIWLRRNEGEDGFNYIDWVKDLWATSAVAIHDYITKESWNKKFDKSPEKINYMIELKTDPLAYLEVLVDVLQEWDRYTVFGDSAFSENALLQSYETQLTVGNEINSYISATLDVSEKEEASHLMSITSISDAKIILTYPNYDPKRVGTKNHCEIIKGTLDRILIDWRNYICIEENSNK
jgi:hypothetical protein